MCLGLISIIRTSSVRWLSFVSMRRISASTIKIIRLSSNWVSYSGAWAMSRLPAQPSLGFPQARQEVSGFGALKLTDEWSVFGDLRYDFELGQFIRNSVGVQYADECFIYALTYQQTYVKIEDIKPDTSVVFRIGIKGFGQQTTPTSIYDISPEAAAYR